MLQIPFPKEVYLAGQEEQPTSWWLPLCGTLTHGDNVGSHFDSLSQGPEDWALPMSLGTPEWNGLT